MLELACVVAADVIAVAVGVSEALDALVEGSVALAGCAHVIVIVNAEIVICLFLLAGKVSEPAVLRRLVAVVGQLLTEGRRILVQVWDALVANIRSLRKPRALARHTLHTRVTRQSICEFMDALVVVLQIVSDVLAVLVALAAKALRDLSASRIHELDHALVLADTIGLAAGLVAHVGLAL